LQSQRIINRRKNTAPTVYIMVEYGTETRAMTAAKQTIIFTRAFLDKVFCRPKNVNIFYLIELLC